MLRATFTKIKRVCVIALVPRIVRGDGRYTTRKFGKTSINVLRKAGKSTDSGSKDGESDCDKCKRLIEFVFGPSKPKDNTNIFKGDNKTDTSNIQEIDKDNLMKTQAKKDINPEKQNSLTKDFFEADEDVVRQDYYKKSYKFKATEINKEPLKQNDNSSNEYDENLQSRQIRDISQSEKQRYCEHYDSKWLSEAEKYSKEECSTDDYNKQHKRSNRRDPDIHDCIAAINYKLQSTTANEHKRKLTQKTENLEETSCVDASSSKVEGFNISPKVLDDQFANYCNSTNPESKSHFQGSLDKIAAKCMNTPASQIDNKVMQEIEKFEIPRTEKQKYTDKDIVQGDNLRKSEKLLGEIEIDLDNKEDKREFVNCTEEDKLGPSFEMPPHLDQGRVNIADETESTYNKMETNRESEIIEEKTKDPYVQKNIDFYHSRPQCDMNQPIIDPYDKKSLALDNDELDEALLDDKLLNGQRIGMTSEIEKKQDHSYKITSGAIPREQDPKPIPVVAEDNTHLDYVQSVYDCAPREINWRPYPSFEAREEVIDFFNQQDMKLDSSKHIEINRYMSSDIKTTADQSYGLQPDHIYTSTSVPSYSREQISHSFVQPEEMINPLMDKIVHEPKSVEEQPENIVRNMSVSFEALPGLNPDDNVSLTELLRRVRMRNRMEYCQEYSLQTLNVHVPETLPVEGKCGKKTPPCPPPPPKCPPPNPCPPPKPACPPAPPPCPNPCKPALKPACPPVKTDPCKKFNGTSIREILTLLTQNNPQMKIPQKYVLPILAYNVIHFHEPLKSNERTFLDANLVCRLSVLGKILFYHCTEAIDANLPRYRSELSFSRDYEPWAPIPSWPIPKKDEKKRFVCPKEGCKVPPPPKLSAPCKENPCINFPKRSNFSLTDLFSFSLVESLVCHST